MMLSMIEKAWFYLALRLISKVGFDAVTLCHPVFSPLMQQEPGEKNEP